MDADHAEFAALEAAHRQAARARRRPWRPPEVGPEPTTTDGTELKDGTELHLALFCLEDLALHLAGADDPAFTAIKTNLKYADVLGGAPPSLPPDPGYGARARDR